MLAPGRFITLAGLALLCLAPSVVACSAETTEPTESAESQINSAISYDGVMNLEGQALRDGLYDLVKNHQRLGYNRARQVLFNSATFLTADHKVECNYTGELVDPNGGNSPGGFNTEHTWPQSLGAGSEPAKSDLHHLFPVLGRANSARGNWPFGTTLCLHDQSSRCNYESGGSALGRDLKGQLTFEVRPEKRGNVARAKFYFAVRYKLAIPADEEVTLRAWHDEDPVDDGERTRNDAVEQLQHNRNPFVDHPEFVAKIQDF